MILAKEKRRAIGKKLLLVLLGTILAAAGLELFLVPNHVIDGGVVGLSIMGDAGLHIPFGVLLMGLILPFIILGIFKVGWRFALLG